MGYIGIFLVAIRAVLGQSCTSQTTEALCTGTGGCKWTNSTGNCGGDKCSGNPTCQGLDLAACSSNGGCFYEAASEGGCFGTTSCSAQTTEDGCDALAGCSWNESTTDGCVGAPSTCSGGTSETNCQLDGCTYIGTAVPAECNGPSPVRCENAINQDTCEILAQNGTDCEWKGPTPAQCRLQLKSDSTCSDFVGPDAIYCSYIPGCTYSGNLGTCTGGAINKKCEEFSSEECETAPCREIQAGECLANSCESYYNEEGRCNAAGCTYSSEDHGCSGNTSISCGDPPEPYMCYETDGCQFQNEYKCVVPSVCDYMGGESCTAAGCIWTEGSEDAQPTCTGVPTVSVETCRDADGRDCSSSGCDSATVYKCSGEIEYVTCDQVGIGGPGCEILGCTSSGVVPGSCTGTIDHSKAESAKTEESCTELGEIYRWYPGDEGGCECRDICIYSNGCSEFTDYGNEICSNLGCTWKSAVEQGCYGTPTNTGKDCDSLTSDGSDTCIGNKCTWVAKGEKTCTGIATGTCSEKTEPEACAILGGCSYSPPTPESCTGTNSGNCNNKGDSSTCGSVNGCTWTGGCSTLTSKTDCEKNNVCMWNQPGKCESERSGASSVYASASVLLLLLVFLW